MHILRSPGDRGRERFQFQLHSRLQQFSRSKTTGSRHCCPITGLRYWHPGGGIMSPTTRLALGITLTSILAAQTQRLPRATSTDTEEPERPNPTNQTMKPLARGTHYAVASMMQQ